MRLARLIPTETIAMAVSNVRSHKFRSFLTVLGIVIGVVTVIVVAALLTGLRNNIVTLVEEYGTSNIFAFHLSTGFNIGPRDRKEFKRKPLKPEDGQAIRDKASAVDDVAHVLFVGYIPSTVKYQGLTYGQGQLQAVSPNYGALTNASIQLGRFINEIDDLHRRDVMVVGISVVEALFPGGENPVGKQIEMAGRLYEIIGVMEKRKGSAFGENELDNSMYIPFRTGQKISPQSEYVMLIIHAKSGQLPAALSQTEEILRRQRGVKFDEADNFDLSTADRLIQQFDSVTAMLGLFAIALSSLGLLVGGIGVMNIMLVSVTERTREIGVRKAIGARRRDIVQQFLFEAMTLTFLGGLLGVVLAVGAAYILKLIFPSLPASIPAWAVLAGLGVSIATGLVFGVWPARKASRLDPIEALRYE